MSKPKIDPEIVIPDKLTNELLTDSEKRMLKTRFLILKLHQQGQSVRRIAAEMKVGTDTVARTIQKLKVSKRLQNAFPKIELSTSQSKWVFGQISSEEEN